MIFCSTQTKITTLDKTDNTTDALTTAILYMTIMQNTTSQQI